MLVLFVKRFVSNSVLITFPAIMLLLCGLISAALAADTQNRYNPYPPAYNKTTRAAPPVISKNYKGVCGSFLVRREAKARFAQQMRGVPNQPPLLVKKFVNVMEIQDTTGPETYDIDRRYCTATVIMNNGHAYPATYVVARNQGFAALGGLHVSFCVVGFDKWLVRDNDCRSLRAQSQSVY